MSNDHIFSEIYRLDCEIEDLNNDRYNLWHKIDRLTDILKQHNIPVPDLKSEIIEINREKYTETIEEAQADLELWESVEKIDHPRREKKIFTLKREIDRFQEKLRDLDLAGENKKEE